MATVNAYAANRYVVAVKVEGKRYKLFQIAFSKRDGSVFVTFPYLSNCQGSLGEVILPKGQNYFENFRVGENFKVTSHQVKYSHHPSGQAHFSLTGKVRASVKTESVSLSEADGHLFTASFQGFTFFNELEPARKPTKKRGIVEFPFSSKNIKSIKFVCHIYSATELAKNLQHRTESPWAIILMPGVRRVLSIPLETPYEFEGEKRYLLLGAEKTQAAFYNQDKGIIFVGGFDREEVVFDYSKESRHLMMFIHEMEDFEVTAKKVGSIDLELSSNKQPKTTP